MNLTQRPRRLRRTPTLRRMVRETALQVDDLIAPLFIAEGRGVVRPISSMPGHAQRSVDQIAAEIDELAELRVPAVLLFGIPAQKDANGSAAWDPDEGPDSDQHKDKTAGQDRGASKNRTCDLILIRDAL